MLIRDRHVSSQFDSHKQLCAMIYVKLTRCPVGAHEKSRSELLVFDTTTAHHGGWLGPMSIEYSG